MVLQIMWYRRNNMSEKQTPHEESSPLIDEAFEDAFEKQAIDSSKKFFVENPIPEVIEDPADAEGGEATGWDLHPDLKPKSNNTKRRIIGAGVGVALAAGAGAGGIAIANAVNSDSPTFSEKTTEYTVQPDDTLSGIVEKIPGINTIDERDAIEYVSVDPANIDVLKDGLQPSEIIEVPISINGAKPLDK
jgi:hypothetical protein